MNGQALLKRFSLSNGVKRFSFTDDQHKKCEIVYENNKEFEELICSIFLLDKYYSSENKLSFGTSQYDEFKEISEDFEKLIFFVTGRKISIEFVPIKKQNLQQLHISSEEFSKEENGAPCLFSGGLDSACGALLLKKSKRNPILSHTATGNIVLGQARRVREHPKINLPLIISDMRLTRFTDADSSQVSTRGLLFLTNALIIASSFGKKQIFFAENGPLMINPTVSSLSYPTKNAHPFLIETLEEIYEKFSQSKVNIVPIFKNNTKAEIIAKVKNDNIIDNTWSCFKIQGQSRMCGLCYACFVRRLSALAAGYLEPSNSYQFDPFLVKRQDLGHYSRIDLDILHDTFPFLKRILDDDIRFEDVEYLIPEHFFKNINELMRRFASDIFLGLRNYQKIIKSQSMGDLGIFAGKILQNVDSTYLTSRENVLRSLENDTREKIQYFS